MILSGRVWKYQTLSAADIVPTCYDYSGAKDWTECASHVLEALDPEFRTAVSVGDILVSGTGIGGGHAHYHQQAIEGVRHVGVSAILGEGFDALFLVAAINVGMPAWRTSGIVEFVDDADEIEVDLLAGWASNRTQGTTLAFKAAPAEVVDILSAGSLDRWTASRLGLAKSDRRG